jgi:hypothetical protein
MGSRDVVRLGGHRVMRMRGRMRGHGSAYVGACGIVRVIGQAVPSRDQIEELIGVHRGESVIRAVGDAGEDGNRRRGEQNEEENERERARGRSAPFAR